MRKYFWFVIFFILLALVFIGYFLLEKTQTYSPSRAVEVIPTDAVFFVELKSHKTLTFLTEESRFFKDFLANTDIFKQIKDLDSLLSKSFSYLSKYKLLVSFHILGRNQLFYLVSLSAKPKDVEKFFSDINHLAKQKHFEFNTKTYDNVKILSLKSSNQRYYFANLDNIIVFSKSELLIEKAIRQKHSLTGFWNDYGYKKLVEQSKKNSDLTLWLKNDNFSEYASLIFKDYNLPKRIKTWSDWMKIDFEFSNNQLIASGFVYTLSLPEKYLYIFKGVKPSKFERFSLLPKKTQKLVIISFDNFSKLYSNYERYLNKNDLTKQQKKLIENFKKGYGIDLPILFSETVEDYIAFCYVNKNIRTNAVAPFIILKLKDRESFRLAMYHIVEKYAKQNNISAKSFVKYVSFENKKFYILKLPIRNLINNLLSELYDIPEHNYCTFLGNYVVFGKSEEDLRFYLNSIASGENLSNNQQFIENFKHNSKVFNLLVYQNFNYGYLSFLQSLKKQYFNFFKQRINNLRKLQFISFKYLSETQEIFRINLMLDYKEELDKNSLIEWEFEAKSPIITKPLVFYDNSNRQKFIFFQTQAKDIFLLNRYGKLIWVKNIPEKIISKIYKISAKEGSYLLFATETYIYLIDINANLQTNYPLKIANGIKSMSYFRYDDGKQRIFVVDKNNNIKVYDINGNIVEGWNFENKFNEQIQSAVKHFSYKGKDYIVFATKLGLYILDRRGQLRINVQKQIPFGENVDIYMQKSEKISQTYFLVNDATGNIHKIYLNGIVQTIELKKNMSSKNYFIAEDINNDKMKELILLDGEKLFVFRIDGNEIFEYSFDNQIEKPPLIFKFSKKDKRIGVVDTKSKLIYLFKSDGILSENFPLYGTELFSISQLFEKDFNLLVGKDKFLYNYQINQ